MVMELALNLVWLALSVSAFAVLVKWSIRQPAGASSRRRQQIVTTAVVCLVALLFPIISITDDLAHDVLLADTTVSRRAPHDTRHHDRIVTAVAVAVIWVPALVFELTSRVLLISHRFVFVARGVLSSLTVRAPPLRVR